MEEAEKKEEEAGSQGEAAVKLVMEEEEEAAEEGQGRREDARRWRRKFTMRRPPELPTLPRRLRALFQVGFLASCARSLHPPAKPSGTPT